MYVCIWLDKHSLDYFIFVAPVAFKGILGHAGIFSYLKLCQPKQTQFPCGSMWSQAHSICFSLILAFSLFNWENKVGPGAPTDPVQMVVSKLVPTVLPRRRESSLTAQLISSEAVFSTWSENRLSDHAVLCCWQCWELCPQQDLSLGLRHLLDVKLRICLLSCEVNRS